MLDIYQNNKSGLRKYPFYSWLTEKQSTLLMRQNRYKIHLKVIGSTKQLLKCNMATPFMQLQIFHRISQGLDQSWQGIAFFSKTREILGSLC